MQSDAKTVEEYLSELDGGRREAIAAVRAVILENLPAGYEETMQHGMICYIVPSSVAAETYNGQPLVYIALASQKRHMSLYLTGVYGDEATAAWFRERYLATGKRMDMGKSCVRFTKLENLPLDLVGEVAAMTPLADFVGQAGAHEGARARRRRARARGG